MGSLSLRSRRRKQPDRAEVPATELVNLIQGCRLEDLQELGGIEGLCAKLQTDGEYGLKETEEQLQTRRAEYGANTYPKKKTKGFWSFVWDDCKYTKQTILMACVALATWIWTEGIKQGRDEGTGIGVALLLDITASLVSDYKFWKFNHCLNAEKENKQLEVLRAGRRQTISTSDIVVGDIVPLSIGGQVPADGVFVEGHSLSIDESTMTGKSLPVKKDRSRPSGRRVRGLIALTGVGPNTTLGQVMASSSADNGDQTPLQVRLNGGEVERCQKAGVKVRMVTGDNVHTAKATAAECCILTAGGLVEGKDFRNWSQAKLNSSDWGLSVYAKIQKFIQFQLTVNVVALPINFVAAVSQIGNTELVKRLLVLLVLVPGAVGARHLPPVAHQAPPPSGSNTSGGDTTTNPILKIFGGIGALSAFISCFVVISKLLYNRFHKPGPKVEMKGSFEYKVKF
jgi:hypothetical protein